MLKRGDICKTSAALALGLIAAWFASSASAENWAPSSSPMELGSAAFAPRGYLQFCERRPDQCGLPTPMAAQDRAELERTMNQEQWSNVFHLHPNAIAAPNDDIPGAEDLTGSVSLEPTALSIGVTDRASTAIEVLADKAFPTLHVDFFHSIEAPSLNPVTASKIITAFTVMIPSNDLSLVPLIRPVGQGLLNQITSPSMELAGLTAGYDAKTVTPPSAARDGEGTPISPPAGGDSPSLSPEPPQTSAAIPLIHLTPLVWEAFNGINQTINARIRPMTDEQAFGVADYWTLPLSDEPRPFGNCKHYALEKRKALVEAGFSPDALSIAIVKTRWGEVHAVLIVDTDKGDYVLDNLSPWIKGWRDVRYEWIERQTPGHPLRWAGVLADAA